MAPVPVGARSGRVWKPVYDGSVTPFLQEGTPRGLEQAVDSLIAAGDSGALLDEFTRLPEVVRVMRAGEDRLDVSIPIANAGAAAAVGLRRGQRGVVDAALEGLLDTYRLADVKAEHPDDDDVRLFEATAGPLLALGAVAGRTEDWATLHKIVSRAPVEGGHYQTWLRHAQVMAARRSIGGDDANVIELGGWQLANHDGYGMRGESDEARHRAVCVFDQLALLIVVGTDWEGQRLDYYPSYAKYPEGYVEDAIIEMRLDGEMRRAIYPASNDQFIKVLREVNEMALLQASQSRRNGWLYRGFQDPRTWLFLREGHILEQWPRLS